MVSIVQAIDLIYFTENAFDDMFPDGKALKQCHIYEGRHQFLSRQQQVIASLFICPLFSIELVSDKMQLKLWVRFLQRGNRFVKVTILLNILVRKVAMLQHEEAQKKLPLEGLKLSCKTEFQLLYSR